MNQFLVKASIISPESDGTAQIEEFIITSRTTKDAVRSVKSLIPSGSIFVKIVGVSRYEKNL